MNVNSVMTQDQSGQELVEFAKATAQRLVRDQLTRSQIRNIFTEVRRIEALWESNKPEALRRLHMLKPKLSYNVARAEPMRHLGEVLSQAIDEVGKAPDDLQPERFKRFMDLFEAILAYHRSEGGRN